MFVWSFGEDLKTNTLKRHMFVIKKLDYVFKLGMLSAINFGKT
jgi:hypothetical protein